MGEQAFKGPRLNGFKLEPHEFTIIGLDTDDGPEHYLWDKRLELPVNEAMVLNMMAMGVIKPVIIVKENGQALVVDGRQRVKAAREADKRLKKMGEPGILVPTLMENRKQTSNERLEAINVSTNMFHTVDSPLQNAARARRLADRGHEPIKIANYMGVSKKAVENWLDMEGLDDELKASVASGETTATAALQFKDLPKGEQAKALKAIQAQKKTNGQGKKVTAKEAKAAADKAKGKDTITVPSKKVLRHIVQTEKDHGLSPEFVAGIAFAIGLAKPDAKVKKAIKAAQAKPAKKPAPAKKKGASKTASA